MRIHQSSILTAFRMALFSLVGVFTVASVSARTWTMKDGRKLEANFIKYDAKAMTVTLMADGKEQLIALRE